MSALKCINVLYLGNIFQTEEFYTFSCLFGVVFDAVASVICTKITKSLHQPLEQMTFLACRSEIQLPLLLIYMYIYIYMPSQREMRKGMHNRRSTLPHHILSYEHWMGLCKTECWLSQHFYSCHANLETVGNVRSVYIKPKLNFTV
jgi:hypothetical protein